MRPDVMVVGAGVFGLWCAWECLRRGLSVTVLERARPGAGASGGPVGALAPHGPDRWDDTRQFQLDALRALPGALAEIEAVGGGQAGHGRVGRVQPLTDRASRDRADALAEGAARRWSGSGMEILPPGAMPGWLDPAEAPSGILRDDLTGRLDPAGTVAALSLAIEARGGRLLSGEAVLRAAPGEVLTRTARHQPGAVVIAAGEASFGLLAAHPVRAGGGVRGQAALLDAALPERPVLQARGIYVVAHASGGVAVGSTSERDRTGAGETDDRLETVIARARALCPAIRSARVLRRWAGLRPRAEPGRPMIGAVPGAPGLYACTGGYKIGFGIGQRAGAAVAGLIAGEAPTLPDGFAPGSRGVPA